MAIENLKKIESFLKFSCEDDFYHLQIIKRKKEHPELGSNNMVVKTYYIRSIEHLEKVYGEVMVLCDYHNARACINLNKRSFEKVAFHTLKKVTDQILNKDYKSVRNAYESVCGTHSNEPEKKWIIDIDVKDGGKRGKEVSVRLAGISPNIGKEKVLGFVETRNGYHLIASPFNVQEAREFLTEDVHRDNPTILYIP